MIHTNDDRFPRNQTSTPTASQDQSQSQNQNQSQSQSQNQSLSLNLNLRPSLNLKRLSKKRLQQQILTTAVVFQSRKSQRLLDWIWKRLLRYTLKRT